MSVIDVEDVKTHLNITADTHDVQLQAMLDGAEAAIAQKCGPLSATPVTETCTGGGTGLVLRQTPVVSLTSVTPLNGSAYASDAVDVDESAGVVEFVSGQRFPAGRYEVAYVAGRGALPADLKLGVLELVRHTWETRRGPTRRPGSDPSETYSNTIPGAAHAFPFRVTELISPHIQVGN